MEQAQERDIVLGAAAMAEADRLTIAAGTPGYTLMLRAGRAVAQLAAAMLRRGAGAASHVAEGAAPGAGRGIPARVLIACGIGNNGGDGYVAARLLQDQGFDVTVWAPFGEPMTADAGAAASAWTGESTADWPAGPFDLAIDALFGAGLNRLLQGEAADAVAALNGLGAPLLAVDLPSGVNADDGDIMGAAVAATATVTFAARKPGHLLLPGRALCGPVTLADIGITAQTLAHVGDSLYRNTPALWGACFPRPSLEAHKYRRGHVLCHSGPALATGAIRLAARAALRSGAGLVTIAADAAACAVHAAHLTAIMLREAADTEAFASLLDDPRFNAVIIGPAGGVGPGLVARIVAAARRGRALVIDADGLTSFDGRPDFLARSIAGAAATVLTPHDGEFARVFGALQDVAEARGKPARALAAAQASGAVVILKGADTVIAAPDGRVAINDNAPPWLGTAGAGDVLAGLTGGLIAQGMPGFEAACAAVWLHGAVAMEFGPGLIAEDLPEGAPAALKRLLGDLGAL